MIDPRVAARARAAAPIDRSASQARAPERWLALIRIVVGFWFLKSLWSKLTWTAVGGVLPVPVASERWQGVMTRRILEWAEVQPIGWYREFLHEVATSHAALFANLTTWGEIVVGIGLTFGLLTGYAALLGLFLLANYTLASIGTNFNQQGLHLVLIACMLAFLGARAGRSLGVDAWLARRDPARFGRIPLV